MPINGICKALPVAAQVIDLVFQHVTRDLGIVFQSELFQNSGAISGDGLWAEVKAFAYFRQRDSATHQQHDFELADR